MNTERRTIPAFNFQEERRAYSAEFKAKVSLAALKGDKSHAELAMEFDIHPNLVSLWKQQTVHNLSRVFDNDTDFTELQSKTTDNCNSKIGQLMAENDFLTKVLGR